MAVLRTAAQRLPPLETAFRKIDFRVNMTMQINFVVFHCEFHAKLPHPQPNVINLRQHRTKLA